MLIKPTYMIAGGIVAAALAFVALRKAGGVVADAANAINPLNNDNIINRAFTDVYRNATGSDGTLGTDFYDFTHPQAAQGTNIVNGGATSIYQQLTGSRGSIGGDFYDWIHS